MKLIVLDNCPICLDAIPYNELHLTICKHIFHYSCINKWYEKKSTCPNCRRPPTKRKYNTETALYVPVQLWWPDSQRYLHYTNWIIDENNLTFI